ncbi:MAG TPA: hypothetical protein VN328_10135, partial [Thermodesulfovibrionales bacterium]|nr:hypothetical protein [Thermodesulfovibrionales bacterium]
YEEILSLFLGNVRILAFSQRPQYDNRERSNKIILANQTEGLHSFASLYAIAQNGQIRRFS